MQIKHQQTEAPKANSILFNGMAKTKTTDWITKLFISASDLGKQKADQSQYDLILCTHKWVLIDWKLKNSIIMMIVMTFNA